MTNAFSLQRRALGLALVGVLMAGCASTSSISGAEARRLVQERGWRLVDVRTADEFAAGHVAGALNIPVDELEARLSELGAKETPLVLYCRSGRRSARAAGLLKERGFTHVADMGPMSRWEGH